MRTYTMELRVDFVDESKYDVLLEAARDASRQLLTVAMLIKDKRDPQISLQSGDMFERNKDLELITPADLNGGE